jgi:hypothetical protein
LVHELSPLGTNARASQNTFVSSAHLRSSALARLTSKFPLGVGAGSGDLAGDHEKFAVLLFP